MRIFVLAGLLCTVLGCGPKEEDARAYLTGIGLTITELKKDKDAFTFKGTKGNEICSGTLSIAKSGSVTNTTHSMSCARDTSACKPGAATECVKIADELYDKDAKVFPETAAELYRIACADKTGHACERAAEYEGIGKHWDKVREYAAQGCELGHAKACYRLGSTEVDGNGTPKNMTKALELFKKSCDLGFVGGCRDTAAMMLDAEPRNLAEALPITEKLCAKKEPDGCYLLGFGLYHEKKNIPRAVEMLEAVCTDKGVQKYASRACNLAGVIYLQELRPKTDAVRALKMFEAACEKGSSDGCFNVGVLNGKGLGGPRNVERANEFKAKACSMGLEKACAK